MKKFLSRFNRDYFIVAIFMLGFLSFLLYMSMTNLKEPWTTMTIIDYNTEETIDISKSKYKLIPNINNKININSKQYTVKNIAYNYANNQLVNVQIIVE